MQRNALQQLGDRDHPGAHDRRAQVAQLAPILGDDLRQRAHVGAGRRAASASGARQPKLGHHQRRQPLQRVVEARHLDAHDAAALQLVVAQRRRRPARASPAAVPAGGATERDGRQRLGASRGGRLRDDGAVGVGQHTARTPGPRGRSALAATDCGTTFTISAIVADPLAHRRDGDARPRRAPASGTNRTTRPRRPAASPWTSCARSAGAQLVPTARAAATSRRAGRAGRAGLAQGVQRLDQRRRARRRPAASWPARARAARWRATPFSSSSTAPAGSRPAARSASRSTDSIACAMSTIGSTPTIAASPLIVCSDRNSSRTWRGVGWPLAAACLHRQQVGVGRRQVLFGLGDEPGDELGGVEPARSRR